MYGLVNRAVEEMIRTRFGDETWARIKAEAGVEAEAFVRMDSYPDCLTYALVEAASRVLEQPAGRLLEAFGEYWTLYTGQEGYGELLRASGRDLWELLQNLDGLHARIGLVYERLTPPSFHCTDIGPDSLVLHYHSAREGLAPMVIGLVKGLGQLFGTPVHVAQILDRVQGADHDAFRIRAAAAA